MANEIQKSAPSAVPTFAPVPNKNDKVFEAFAGQSFLPRLTMEGSNSTLTKRKKIATGNYSFTTGKEQFEDLGASVDILVLSHRFKAIDMRKVDSKRVLCSYDAESEVSKRIMGLCATIKEKKGLAYGNELLVWVPSAKNEIKYATLHLGSPTSRQVAGSFAGMVRRNATTLQKQATLKHRVIEKDYIWEAIEVFPCNSPLNLYPDPEEARIQIETFNNPVEGIFQDEEAATEEEMTASTSQEV